MFDLVKLLDQRDHQRGAHIGTQGLAKAAAGVRPASNLPNATEPAHVFASGAEMRLKLRGNSRELLGSLSTDVSPENDGSHNCQWRVSHWFDQ